MRAVPTPSPPGSPSRGSRWEVSAVPYTHMHLYSNLQPQMTLLIVMRKSFSPKFPPDGQRCYTPRQIGNLVQRTFLPRLMSIACFLHSSLTVIDSTTNEFHKQFPSPCHRPQNELAGRNLYWPRGKIMGGSTSINAMMYQVSPVVSFLAVLLEEHILSTLHLKISTNGSD